MYYLLDVTGYPSIRVVSRHRTQEAADGAAEKLQRAVKRANGQSSYLMLRIVEADARAVNQRHPSDSEGEAAVYYARDRAERDNQ